MALLSCAHRAPKEAETSACAGLRKVSVKNSWSQPVEVFTRIGSTPNQFYIGTVEPGRQELFQLPAGARFASVQQTGRIPTQQAMPPSSYDLVDVRYLCE